ncbi:MAG: acetyl-CoA carboxylase biotin carboxylase subunit family protein [Synergistales bacterium]
MNIVLVSPHFPPNYVNFSAALRRRGAQVLGIVDQAPEELRAELREALTDVIRVDDLHRTDQVAAAVASFRDRYGPINRLESHNEHWLDSDARLRREFGIPGLKPDELVPMRRKSLMKEVFSRAGLSVARGRIVHDLEEALGMVSEVGFPVVLKPDQGVGATGTWKMRDRRELERFFAEKPPVEMFMEEFITGGIVTFDGLADRDGRVVFCASLRYADGMMEMVNDRLDIFLHTLRELPADLVEAGSRAVAAFGLKERFFHLEFFRTSSDDRLVALEVNVRPPGGLILDMYNFSSDIDLFDEWARLLTETAYVPVPFERRYHCAFLGRRDGRRYAHDHESVLRAYGNLLVHQERVPAVFSPAMGDVCYLLRSPDMGVIREAASYVLAPEQEAPRDPAGPRA